MLNKTIKTNIPKRKRKEYILEESFEQKIFIFQNKLYLKNSKRKIFNFLFDLKFLGNKHI